MESWAGGIGVLDFVENERSGVEMDKRCRLVQLCHGEMGKWGNGERFGCASLEVPDLGAIGKASYDTSSAPP
jgi:hypothetical protein